MIDNFFEEKLINRISAVKKNITALPPGRIIFIKNYNYEKYYLKSDDGTKRILNKKNNEKLLSDMILKEYYELKIKDLTGELNALINYKKYRPAYSEANLFLIKSPFIKNTILKRIGLYSDEDIEWANKPRENTDFYPAGLTVKSSCGIMVRSKSEAIIANELFNNNILFRYEAPFNGKFPDYTILHPLTKQKWIWEHLGKMDNEKYFDESKRKMDFYFKYGYFLGKNLIITAETENSPLNCLLIKHTVEDIFLNDFFLFNGQYQL